MSYGSLETRGHGRSRVIQAGRAIAAIMVVICHASSFVGADLKLWHQYEWYLWLRGTALGVQCFFVLSGIVIFHSYMKDTGGTTPIVFLWKRFIRIYPLYWIAFVITAGKQLLQPNIEYTYQTSPWVLLSGLLLVHVHSVETNMVVAWSLFDEVSFYLLFAVLLYKRFLGGALLLIWFVASLLLLQTSNIYAGVLFSPNYLLFGMGMAVAWLSQQKVRFPAQAVLGVGILVLFSAVIVAGHLPQKRISINLLSGVAAACSFFGALDLERKRLLNIPSLLVRIGDASYSIYLTHYIILSAIAHGAFRFFGRHAVPASVWLCVLVLCGVGSGLIVYAVIEAPLLHYLKKISPVALLHR